MLPKKKKDEDRKKFTTVSIPTPLFKKVEARIKDTGFTSVSSYVAYVLREIVAEVEDEEPFSEEDKERVKERLRALGYID
ncbi:MAG: CopG family transcriptional regulator [Candidatus Bathyarchaeota archaeon]|nr:MAG: CopG family transcriptional regulator [Candidatus Bathyarchaeota archaeon]